MPKTDLLTEFFAGNFMEDLQDHDIEGFMIRLNLNRTAQSAERMQ